MGWSSEQHHEEPAGNIPAGYLVPNGTCTRCNAPVAWVKTAYGKNLPLDPEPSTSSLQANFGLTQDGVALYVRDSARVRAFDGARSEFPIYVAHFTTCGTDDAA